MPLQCCRSPPRDSRDKGNERSAEDIEGLDSLPVLSARVPHRHGGMEPSNLVCVLSPLSMFEGSHSSRARPSAGVATQKIRRVYMFMFKVPIPHFLCGSARVHLVTKPVRRCYLSSLAGARQSFSSQLSPSSQPWLHLRRPKQLPPRRFGQSSATRSWIARTSTAGVTAQLAQNKRCRPLRPRSPFGGDRPSP